MIPSVGKAIRCVFNDDLDGLMKLSIDEIKETDEQGRTALHAACFKGYPKMLNHMIEKLGDEAKTVGDIQDNQGKTAAHYACGEEWSE